MKTKIQQNHMKARINWIVLILSLLLLITIQFPQQLRAVEAGTDDPGIFRVGLEANYTPFNWSQSNNDNSAIAIVNSPGEYANGYDVWMADKIASALGLKLELIKLEWDGLVPALESGKIEPDLATLVAIAKYFKVTLDYLVGITDY